MNRLLAAIITASVSLGGAAMAQDSKHLDATASNPMTLGWMQGFPPAADKTIRFADPDYFAFPELRWTVCHFRALMPSVAVRSGSDGPSALLSDLDAGLDGVAFTPLGGGDPMTWKPPLARITPTGSWSCTRAAWFMSATMDALMQAPFTGRCLSPKA